MTKTYPKKRIKVYAFRQFQKTIEQERQQTVKSGKQKEVVISGYGRIKEQIINYPKIKASRIVYRDNKGRFTKIPHTKIIPEKEKTNKRFFGESPYHRASVYINVPWKSNKKRGINNYFWFGVVVIDKPEKIDIKWMHEECIKLIEKELHYNRHSLDWFDWEHPSIEYPKPYPAIHPDISYEKWSKTRK